MLNTISFKKGGIKDNVEEEIVEENKSENVHHLALLSRLLVSG